MQGGRGGVTEHAREAAQTLALRALGFLAARPEDFARFLALSGADVETVRGQAQDPAFLGFVMTFLSEDEEAAAAFCQDAGLSPEAFAAARAALPGGEEVSWL